MALPVGSARKVGGDSTRVGSEPRSCIVGRPTLMITDDASSSFLDWCTNRQEITMTAVENEREALVRNAEETCGSRDAAAGIFECFADQAAFIPEDFGVE